MGDRTRNAHVCWIEAFRRWQALPIEPHLVTGLCDDPEGKGQMGAIRAWWKFDTPSHPAMQLKAGANAGQFAGKRDRLPRVVIVRRVGKFRPIFKDQLPWATEVDPKWVLVWRDNFRNFRKGMDSGQDHQKQQRGPGKSFVCLHHSGLRIRDFRSRKATACT